MTTTERIKAMQADIAEAQDAVAEPWAECIQRQLRDFAGYHDIGRVMKWLATEYPDEYAEHLPWRAEDKIARDAVCAARDDREHFDELRTQR